MGTTADPADILFYSIPLCVVLCRQLGIRQLCFCALQVSALSRCQNEEPQVVQVETDAVATNIVYMAAPCNDTVAASTVLSDEGEAEALASEVKELRKQLARKDDVLRVRNNQLAEISKLLDERESLWNASLVRTSPALHGFAQ